MGSYRILYEDREILVCHKPAGLPVQSGRIGMKDLESILNLHLKEEGCRETKWKKRTWRYAEFRMRQRRPDF